jgi:E3 ubiquitin-protein ligase TRIP12
MLSALTELRDIVLESDISPFEMNYSGLIKALLNYLTTTDAPGNRYDRLRMFWKLFAESTVSKIDLKNFFSYLFYKMHVYKLMIYYSDAAEQRYHGS